MAKPQPTDASNTGPFNRLHSSPSFAELVPRTTIPHVFSKRIEELADDLNRQRQLQILYPFIYDWTRERLDLGMSHEEIRVEMEKLAGIYEKRFGVDIKQAIEDALAGRPPKYR